MSTANIRRYSAPDALKEIAPANLLAMLRGQALFLSERGIILPASQALVTDAHKSVSFGRETTKGAEETLLRALGIENWKPPEPLTYTRHASDVFAAGRFDAEMLQPRYDALRAKLEKVAREAVPPRLTTRTFVPLSRLRWTKN